MFKPLQRFAPLILLLMGTAASCSKPGPAVVVVRGKVTYNGQPVTTGMVKFIPTSLEGEKIRPATGPITEDGIYQMTAFPGRNGSRPGEYQVAIVAYTGSFADGTAQYVVPKRFADPQTSGLKATIPIGAEPMTLDFDLVE